MQQINNEIILLYSYYVIVELVIVFARCELHVAFQSTPVRCANPNPLMDASPVIITAMICINYAHLPVSKLKWSE